MTDQKLAFVKNLLSSETAAGNSALEKIEKEFQGKNHSALLFNSLYFEILPKKLFPALKSQKEALLAYMKNLSTPEKQIAVAAALDENTSLGQVFRIQRGFRKTSIKRGTLKEIAKLQTKLPKELPSTENTFSSATTELLSFFIQNQIQCQLQDQKRRDSVNSNADSIGTRDSSDSAKEPSINDWNGSEELWTNANKPASPKSPTDIAARLTKQRASSAPQTPKKQEASPKIHHRNSTPSPRVKTPSNGNTAQLFSTLISEKSPTQEIANKKFLSFNQENRLFLENTTSKTVQHFLTIEASQELKQQAILVLLDHGKTAWNLNQKTILKKKNVIELLIHGKISLEFAFDPANKTAIGRLDEFPKLVTDIIAGEYTMERLKKAQYSTLKKKYSENAQEEEETPSLTPRKK